MQHVLLPVRQNSCRNFNDIGTFFWRDNTEENCSVWFSEFRIGVTFIEGAEYLARFLFILGGYGKPVIMHHRFVLSEQTVRWHFCADVL